MAAAAGLNAAAGAHLHRLHEPTRFRELRTLCLYRGHHFGTSTPNWAKPVVIMSVIAAFAVVAAADIVARGYAAGRRGDIISIPDGLVAAYTPGTDQRVAAGRYRSTEDDKSQFLIVKEDNSAVVAAKDDLNFAKVPAPHEKRRGV